MNTIIAAELNRVGPEFVFFQNMAGIDALRQLRVAARGLHRETMGLIRDRRLNDVESISRALESVRRVAFPNEVADFVDLDAKLAGQEISRFVATAHIWHREIRRTLRAAMEVITPPNDDLHSLIDYIAKTAGGSIKIKKPMQKMCGFIDRLWDFHATLRDDIDQYAGTMPATAALVKNVLPNELDRLVGVMGGSEWQAPIIDRPAVRDGSSKLKVPAQYEPLLTLRFAG